MSSEKQQKHSAVELSMTNTSTSIQRRLQRVRSELEKHVSPQYLQALWPSHGEHETAASPRSIPLRAHHAAPLVDAQTGRPYINNNIRSSRYTIYDFVPKQLIFQATRLSNFYFIVIGIPQTIPGFSTTGNYTTILPLVFFMLLTILKEGYDDLRRHRLDKKENQNLATRYARKDRTHGWRAWLCGRQDAAQDSDWHAVRWSSVRVGDILKIRRDEDLAADVVLLHADSEDGIAYIETMALDGETNLKPRQAVSALQQQRPANLLSRHDITVTVEGPNRDLYNFSGRLEMPEESFPLTNQEIIYRGCTLRNTKSVVGLVVNTGEQCKIRMNSNHHPKAKKPRLESYSNQIVITLIIYVILLSVGCSIGYLLWQNQTESVSWYLNDAAVPFKQIIIGFGIMFNNVIPLALYVSLEIVKIGQVLMITSDLDMYDEDNKAKMRCNTNTILENLGQIGFVLSDKTGTLTQNIMRFKAISVGGHAWSHVTQGDQMDHVEAASVKKSIHIEITRLQTLNSVRQLDLNDDQRTADRRIHRETTTALLAQMSKHPRSELASLAREFILAMGVCNSCIPEHDAGVKLSWQSSSPDELALVRAAADLQCALVKRTANSLTVQLGEQQCNYKILDTIEFSSQRKRMSIILQCPDGRIWLVCKGADNMILPRLREAEAAMARSQEVKRSIDIEHQRQRRSFQITTTSGRPSVTIERIRHSLDPGSPTTSMRRDHNHEMIEILRAPRTTFDINHDLFGNCFRHVEKFAIDGLRTLMFAHKYLDEEEYRIWKKHYREASTSIENRQEQMELVAEEIEQSLDLLGATAIEDRLQDGVPETIDKLRRANIHIWMLTGDKRETAINIAYSARICRPESNILILDATVGDLEQQLHNAAEEVMMAGLETVAVIDGQTLSLVEASPVLTKLFFSITPAIGSVICCRASPAQKAFIVKAIQQCVPKAVTLAIGDGANDIAMIQTAHVGVGVSGKEGMQASRVADYSIGQFSFLQKLLLVHGRWSYVRTAKFVLWTFWKEMFFYMMQVLYQQYTGYSGSSLYENWSLTALNTLFTSLCVILPGIFEQDLRADTLLGAPELYVYGQTNQGLNLLGYLMWMAGATVEGLIVWYLPWALYGSSSYMSDNGAFALGNMMFSIAIMWTNFKLLMIETHLKTKVIITGFLITIAGWWVWNVFLSGVYSDNLSPFDVRGGLFQTYGKDPCWWATFFVTLVALSLLDLSIKSVRRMLIVSNLWPFWRRRAETRAQERELEAWQEMEQRPGFIERLRSRDATDFVHYTT